MAACGGLLCGLADAVWAERSVTDQCQGFVLAGAGGGVQEESQPKTDPAAFHAAAAADLYYRCSVKQPAITGNISYTSNTAQHGHCHSEPNESLSVMTCLAVLEAITTKC